MPVVDVVDVLVPTSEVPEEGSVSPLAAAESEPSVEGVMCPHPNPRH